MAVDCPYTEAIHMFTGKDGQALFGYIVIEEEHPDIGGVAEGLCRIIGRMYESRIWYRVHVPTAERAT